MTVKIPKIDDISLEDQTSWVLTLLECLNVLVEENKDLRDEIGRLKGETTRPKIKPSSLEKKPKKLKPSGKRPFSAKRHKTKSLEIHDTIKVPPENIAFGFLPPPPLIEKL